MLLLLLFRMRISIIQIIINVNETGLTATKPSIAVRPISAAIISLLDCCTRRNDKQETQQGIENRIEP